MPAPVPSERFALLAAYLEDTENQRLRWMRSSPLRRGRERPPKNLGRDLRIALDRGLIEPVGPHPDEIDDPRDATFSVTQEGRETVGVQE